MKKVLMVISSLVVVAVVAFVEFSTQEIQTETKTLKYADARLSVLKLQQGIEVKIAILLDEGIETNVKPTEKGLRQLVQSIATVRDYGKDIRKETKENLRKMVKQLKSNGFENEKLLEELDELASTSQKIIV